MPKPKKQMGGGPYIAAAMICEKMLVESDRVISTMRIIDTITLPLLKRPLPKGGLIALQMTLVVFFKAGDFRGKRQLRIALTNPSGKTEPFLEKEVDFEPAGELPETGVNIGVVMHIKWDKPGLYWFDISLDDRLVTRVPFRLKIAQPESPKKAGQKAT